MNNDIVNKGNDFVVQPLEKNRFTFNSANDIPVRGDEIIKCCEPGTLCNPEPEFEMIENCKNCNRKL